jgi:hypothetical protein
MLERIEIYPEILSLRVNQSYDFAACGLDQYGEPVDVNVTWSATGGTITKAGFYTAGSDTGTFYVIAQDPVTNIQDSSVVHVGLTTEVTQDEAARIPTEFASVWIR